MLFFGFAYPIVPFWGDDWQMMSTYGSLKPTMYSWIPARLLPPMIQTGMGIISVYVIMPLSGLDFIDSIILMSAITLSVVYTLLSIILYRLILSFGASKWLGLCITSIFIISGFCMMKAHSMPLLLPADLQAEGMGYIFTLISFYIIPNVLNLALLCIVCYLLALRLNLVQKPITIAPQPLWILTGGGVVILYLAQFSIISASLILASFCGISLFVEYCYFIAKDTKHFYRLFSFLKTLGLYGLICLVCLLMWCVAAYYDIHSGRAEYCGAFNLSFGISYMYNSLKLLRTGFLTLFILAGIGILIKAYKDSSLRPFILMCVYILLVSKCGAKFHLISGLFLSMLWLMCVACHTL